MISKKSRYANTRRFAIASRGEPGFRGIRPRRIAPAAGVLEYTIRQGDRLDLLALNFYNDSQRWWRILDANPEVAFGADLMLDEYVGETILIPGGAGGRGSP